MLDDLEFEELVAVLEAVGQLPPEDPSTVPVE